MLERPQEASRVGDEVSDQLMTVLGCFWIEGSDL